MAGKVKLELAQFRELAAFSQFESDLDATTARLDRGARIVEMFKQTAFNPIPVEVQTAIMWECKMISLILLMSIRFLKYPVKIIFQCGKRSL